MEFNPIIIALVVNIASNFLSNRLEDGWKGLNNLLVVCGYYYRLPSKDEITFNELFGNGLTNIITLSDGTMTNPLIFYQASNLFKPKKRKNLWKDIVDQATNYGDRMFCPHSNFLIQDPYLELFNILWNDLSHKEKVKLHKIHLAVTNTEYYKRLIQKCDKLEIFINTYDNTKFFKNTVKKAKKFLEKMDLWRKEHERDINLALTTEFINYTLK